MKSVLAVILLAACQAMAALPAPGEPGAPNDPRYAGEPRRDKHGTIVRSRAVLRRFVSVFPCPATLKPTTHCPGWEIDHVLPLADGGADAAINLQWLPTAIKRCARPWCKDRFERIYHSIPRQPVNLKGKP